MKLCRILVVALFFGSREGEAQTGVAASGWPSRRWAVGTQLAFYPRFSLVESADGQGGTKYVRSWPVMPTIAYRTKQRVSYEAGLLLRTMPTRTITEANSSGTSVTLRRATSWAVLILVRSQLRVPNPRRWQVDFAIGFMPLAADYYEEGSYTDAKTGLKSSFGAANSYSDFLLIGGLGGAYALTPNLSLTADARVTVSLLLAVVGAALSNNGIKNDITPFAPALSTGVSYQFGKAMP